MKEGKFKQQVSLVNSEGKLVTDNYDTGSGGESGILVQVVETPNYYFASGWLGNSAIIMRIDVADPSNYTTFYYESGSRSRFLDIEYLQVGNKDLLIVGGFGTDNSNNQRRRVVVFEINPNGDLGIKDEILLSNPSGISAAANALAIDHINGEMITIYLASIHEKSNNIAVPGGRRLDSDILMSSINYNADSGNLLVTGLEASHNSIKQTPHLEFIDWQNLNPTDIFNNYPPNEVEDVYPFGPSYIGSGFERDIDGWDSYCAENLQNADGIEFWADGSEDVPYSIVIEDDKIYVTALLNKFIMWHDQNKHLHDPQDFGLDCHHNGVLRFSGIEYQWGEGYLLQFDKNNLGLTNATHLGTYTGADFHFRMIQRSGGGFAIASTLTGRPEGIPQGVSPHENSALILVDQNGTLESRSISPGPLGRNTCGFGVVESLEGDGFIVVGNTGDPDHDINNVDPETGGENYSLIKFSGKDFCYNPTAIDHIPDEPAPLEYAQTYDNREYVIPNTHTNSQNQTVVGTPTNMCITTWNSDKTISTNVIVPYGAHLRIIGSTMQFADSYTAYPDGNRTPIGITIQPGGRLTVANSVLKAWNCNGDAKMWDGIVVEGQPNKYQNQTNQGFCVIHSGSEIRDARRGVVGADFEYVNTPVILDPPSTSVNGSQEITGTSVGQVGFNSGARIRVFGSSFINNKRSAIFMKYDKYNYSTFGNCNFISNAPLIDDNMSNNALRGTQIHASVWGTYVNFEGCNFTGANSITPNNRPFGIVGSEADLDVTGGTMTNLKVGIEHSGYSNSVLASLKATSVTFNNVYQGINLRATLGDDIRHCTFENMPANSANSLVPTGIFGDYPNACLILDNHFSSFTNSGKKYGIVMTNTDDDGVVISENTFDNLTIGNQFEGENYALTTNCNDYSNMKNQAWSCVKKNGIGVLTAQGDPSNFGDKPNNQFFDVCSLGTFNHIYSEFPFQYYEHAGNPNPADQACITSEVLFNTSVADSGFDCEEENTPCTTPNCVINQFCASDKSIKKRNEAIRQLQQMNYYKSNANYGKLSGHLIDILNCRGENSDKELMIGTYIANGQTNQAQVLLNSINPNQASAFTNNALAIAQSGNASNPFANTISQEDLENPKNLVHAMEQNKMFQHRGLYFPLVPVEIGKGEGGKGRDAADEDISENASATTSIKVYPNPIENFIVFDLSESVIEATYKVEIHDVFGRLILKDQIEGGNEVRINTSYLGQGSYFFNILTKNELIQSGRFTKVLN